MKKIFFFIAIAALTLTSCKKEATSSSQEKTVAQNLSQAKATTSGGAFTFHDIFEEIHDGETVKNDCTNDLMTTTRWVLHYNIHGVYNGNKSTITFHGNLQGFKAVGESGREYVASNQATYQESSFSNGVFTSKWISDTHVNTAGSANNMVMRETFYIKVDANGNITYIREPITEVHCQ